MYSKLSYPSSMEETRKPTYDELLVENAQLKQEVARQAEHIVGLEALVVELNAKIDTLTKMLFGKKSEKSKEEKEKPPEQQSNESKPTDEPKQPRKKNGGGGRNSFHKGIPRRDVHV